MAQMPLTLEHRTKSISLRHPEQNTRETQRRSVDAVSSCPGRHLHSSDRGSTGSSSPKSGVVDDKISLEVISRHLEIYFPFVVGSCLQWSRWHLLWLLIHVWITSRFLFSISFPYSCPSPPAPSNSCSSSHLQKFFSYCFPFSSFLKTNSKQWWVQIFHWVMKLQSSQQPLSQCWPHFRGEGLIEMQGHSVPQFPARLMRCFKTLFITHKASEMHFHCRTFQHV